MAAPPAQKAEIGPTLRAHLELFNVTHDRPALRAALVNLIEDIDESRDGGAEEKYVDMDQLENRITAFFLRIIESAPWRILLLLSIMGAVGTSMLLTPNPPEETSDTQRVFVSHRAQHESCACQVLLIIDLCFVIVFTIESLVCMAALGVKGYVYSDPVRLIFPACRDLRS